jgi:hypothetical protein
MLRTLLRTVPWRAVIGIACAAIALGAVGLTFPAVVSVFFATAFALLAGSAALLLDDPASVVVDCTPTGVVPRTAIRSLGVLAPLAAGFALVGAGVLRGIDVPWAAVSLALVGGVVLGFTVACVARARAGEPGAAAATTVVLVLLIPGLLPFVPRWIHTFPSSVADSRSSERLWSIVIAVCVLAVSVTVTGFPRIRWTARRTAPGAGLGRRQAGRSAGQP